MKKGVIMKKIKISSKDIRMIVNRLIKEQEELYSLSPQTTEYPREKGLKDIFGSYTKDVPNDVIRYMRKNPKLIFDRLYFEYGDKAYEYLDMAKNKYFKQGGEPV